MSKPYDSPASPPNPLIPHLLDVLLDLEAHSYPTISNPPGVPKRASVALILRIQPHYTHWPPSPSHPTSEASHSPAERIRAFLAEDWVRHGDPEVLFIKRAAREGDKWTSHVALPGGRRDPEDADDAAAAVREAYEEVGVSLAEEDAVCAGGLPQQVVSSGWGTIPLMVLCPYVFLITRHEIPPLRLQPSEVASTHWVPLRALLSPRHRTFWFQDVSNRTSRHDLGFTRWIHRWSLGDMMFAAVRLIASESKYCSSIDEFLPTDGESAEREYISGSADHTAPLLGSGHNPTSPVDQPLLLWGLTLGVLGDFLDMLPPHNALRIWTYPTFTTLDARFWVWLLSYRFRRQRDAELAACRIPVAGREGARKRLDQKGSRANAVGMLLEGYYAIVRKAVVLTFGVRAAVVLAVVWAALRRLRSR